MTMYKGKPKVSVFEAIGCGVALTVAIVLGCYWHSLSTARKDEETRHNTFVGTTQQAIDQIRKTEGVTKAALEAMRVKAQDWESRLLTEAQWEACLKKLGAEWSFGLGENAQEPKLHRVTRRGELSFLNQSVADSNRITEALEQLEALSPLVGVERLIVMTTGDSTNRHFTTVRISVSIPLRAQ